MLRGSLFRRRAPAPVALLIVAACAGTVASSGAHGAIEFSRGHATIVTLENARYDPPRTIGLVSENHPGVKSDDAALRRSGFKKAATPAIDALLDRLESQGFLASCVRVPSLRPLDPATQLSRLSVTIDAQIVEVVVPRRPNKELADAFTLMARSVTEMFNEIIDLRPSRAGAEVENFLDVQHRLFEANREKLRSQNPPDGSK